MEEYNNIKIKTNKRKNEKHKYNRNSFLYIFFPMLSINYTHKHCITYGKKILNKQQHK